MSFEAAFDYKGALDLRGQAFVVLGVGGGGIGTQASLALSQAGAELLCVDSQADQAHEVAQACGSTEFVADITSREEMQVVFDKADQLFGDRFTGVVDIVGFPKMGQISSFSDSDIDEQFNSTFRHALLATQIAAPMLAHRHNASMTFISSVSGFRAVYNQALYGIAKAALNHLIRQAAFEFGPSGVRFNGIAPGFVKTPRLQAVISDENWDGIAADIPFGRAAEPSDVACATLFLVSNLAKYVTGNILMLDGAASQFMRAPSVDV